VTDAELLADLDQALDASAAVVAGIRAEQWQAPTPCTELDVRGVLNHLVSGNLLFVALVHGGPRPDRAADHLGTDPLAAFQNAAAGLRTAFATPGVLEQVYTAPFGTAPGAGLVHVRIVETLTHGWDLARASGQAAEFPGEVTERALASSKRNLTPQMRGQAFGAEVPAPDDASAIDRLAAFLGRPYNFRAAP
jgi:uncharacterized protein (TIGR03086 family)